ARESAASTRSLVDMLRDIRMPALARMNASSAAADGDGQDAEHTATTNDSEVSIVPIGFPTTGGMVARECAEWRNRGWTDDEDSAARSAAPDPCVCPCHCLRRTPGVTLSN